MNKQEYLFSKEGEDLSHDGMKEVVLALENCEYIVIPREDIGAFIVKDFKESFARIASNQFSHFKTAEYVILQIKNSSRLYRPFEGLCQEPYEPTKLFNRLTMNDICVIEVNYLWDDEHYSWYIDYDEGEYKDVLGAPNINQVTVDKFGDIWIAIGAKAKEELEEYFPENQKVRDLLWRLRR